MIEFFPASFSTTNYLTNFVSIMLWGMAFESQDTFKFYFLGIVSLCLSLSNVAEVQSIFLNLFNLINR
jgi:hypothetical protein